MQWKALCSVAVLALCTQQAFAIPIYIDTSGREWLDLNQTRYRSWNDAASVCDVLSGGCSGVLSTHTFASSDIDISGYQWATRNEVRSLFYEVAGLPAGSLDTWSTAFPVASGFGSAAFEVLEPTIQFAVGPGIQNIYNGVTRDTYRDADMLLHGVSGIIDNRPYGSDHFTLDSGLGVDTREISMGVYLYKPKAVPEPGTLALFAFGVGAVTLAVRRRRAPALRANA